MYYNTNKHAIYYHAYKTYCFTSLIGTFKAESFNVSPIRIFVSNTYAVMVVLSNSRIWWHGYIYILREKEFLLQHQKIRDGINECCGHLELDRTRRENVYTQTQQDHIWG
jgi:hypothetical protein